MSSGGRVVALDGLRAVAVLAVIANHTGNRLASGGYLGVDVFFVLSGYLITGILLSEHDNIGRLSLGRFYARRALRLYPALTLAVLIVLGLALSDLIDSADVGWHAIVSLLYLQDLANAFGLGPALGPLNHTWSLAIEEHFYLLWPLVLIVVAPHGRRAVALVSLTLAVASFVLMQVQFSPSASPTSTVYYHPEARAAALLLGCVLAAVPRVRPPAWLTSAALVALVLTMALSPTANTRSVFLVSMPVVWVSTALLILGCSSRAWWVKVLELRPVVWIGLVSYGLYLYHPLTFAAVEGATGARRIVVVVLGTLLAFVVATVSYYVVEKPALRLKSKFNARTSPGPVGA